MSKTVIKKVRKENPFLVLDKTCINEIDLSWGAKGLHTYIMGLPDDWNIYLEEVSKHCRDTYEATIKAMDELIVYGYATKERLRNENGQYGAYQYTVFEEPISVDDETIKSILSKSIYKKSKVVHGFKKSDYITELSTVNIENTIKLSKLENLMTDKNTSDSPKLLNNNQLNNNLTKYISDDDEQVNIEIKTRLKTYKDATNKKINQGVKKLIQNSIVLSNQLFEELAYKSSNKDNPFNYLKICIENCIRDNELTLEDYRKERVSNDKTFRKSNNKSNNSTNDDFEYKKTKFHNFNETFTDYSPNELDEIIEKSQKEKFGNENEQKKEPLNQIRNSQTVNNSIYDI